MKKNVFALLLCILMIFSILPVSVFADDKDFGEPVGEMITEIPDYFDFSDGDEINATIPGNGDVVDETVYTTPESAAAALRNALCSRKKSITISWYIQPSPNLSLDRAIIEEAKRVSTLAYEHTGNPYEGNYLLTTTSVKGAFTPSYVNYRSYYYDGDQMVEVGKFDLYYVLTEQQDSLFKTKSDEAIASMDLEGKTEYEKACAVYGYVINHARYVNTANSYKAYGPLVERKGTCEGVSLLIYHLMLRAGIDCRYLMGYSTQTGSALHAWNLVRVGGIWYNVDATFDLRGNPTSPYYDTTNVNGARWLLKCDYTFENDRYGSVHHTPKSGVNYYPELTRAAVDCGEELISENDRLVIKGGELKVLVFTPEETDRYYFRGLNKDLQVSVECDPYFYSENVGSEVLPDDAGSVYHLEAGHRYLLTVKSYANETAELRLMKYSDEQLKVVSVKCKDVIHYVKNPIIQSAGKTYIRIHEVGFTEKYQRFDIKPVKMSVELSDGTIIEGSFEDVIDQLMNKYMIEVKYFFKGDTQDEKPWKVGKYPIVLYLNEVKTEYTVLITPYKDNSNKTN